MYVGRGIESCKSSEDGSWNQQTNMLLLVLLPTMAHVEARLLKNWSWESKQKQQQVSNTENLSFPVYLLDLFILDCLISRTPAVSSLQDYKVQNQNRAAKILNSKYIFHSNANFLLKRLKKVWVLVYLTIHLTFIT